MAARQTVRIELASFTEEMTWTAKDFLEFMAELAADLPPNVHVGITFDPHGMDQYDDYCGLLEFWYERPETDGEMKDRLRIESEREQLRKRRTMEADRDAADKLIKENPEAFIQSILANEPLAVRLQTLLEQQGSWPGVKKPKASK